MSNSSLLHTARSNSEAYALRMQMRGISNDWVFTDPGMARSWRERAFKKLQEEVDAAKDAALRELWEPVVDAAVLAVTDDEWLNECLEDQIEQAAIAILVARVANYQEKEKLKNEARKAFEADEKKRAGARDELKKKREKDRKDKERKEKAELAALKKEFTGASMMNPNRRQS